MTQVFEGVGIAVAALRANKTRAALTILGIAIGVMVVMVIASIINGINTDVARLFEEAGSRTFFVDRYFRGGITVSDGSDEMSPWRRRPHIRIEEAERLTQLPSVAFVDVMEFWGAAASFEGKDLGSVTTEGRTENWIRVSGGDVYPGRSFTRVETLTSARVVVVTDKFAERLFGQLDPVGKTVKLNGQSFEVIGMYTPPPNLFGDGEGPRAIMPHSTLNKYLKPQRGWMRISVTPIDSVSVADAIDEATIALRTFRGLRPGQESNFDIVTQDKLLDMWNNVTGVFFLVMIVLSGVGLMVGGVGVIAIMMISVTERTREIGVRKALGARKREILWQFLVEASTLTLIGGVVGMILGGGIAFIVSQTTPLPTTVPLWAVVAALGAAAFTGIIFGIYPAARAARLDPVEALRYE
ncbi:MAG: ABC transporter permease [Gemmatimonadota bacterium]|nr:ABC transporter permease [Gemmatimonadota bacterium]MDH5196502.1 ABC transporter permease [Gemmatimonadota bacterium]